jgi:hemerythrin
MSNNNASTFNPIAWSPIFEVNNPDIDDDHRLLIENANTLLEMMTNKASFDQLLSHAKIMRDECREHFSKEEEVLRKEAFSGLDDHTNEHRRIEREIDDIIERMHLYSSENPLVQELILTFRSCLLDHLLRYDLKYKSHLMNTLGY